MAEKSSERICAVCSDRACGHNYSVLTCVSCKTFFQRYGMGNVGFKCKYENNCQMTCVTRKWCSKCRLKKCFAVGMKKEYLMTDTDKKLRMAKIKEKRLLMMKIKSQPLFDNTISSSEGVDTSYRIKDILDQIFDDKSVNEMDLKEEIMEIEKSLSNNDLNNIFDYLNKKESKIESSVIPIIRPITDYNNNFNEFEGKRLTEVLNAMQYLNSDSGEARVICEAHDYFHAGTFWAPHMEKEIPNIVKMSKDLSLFRDICENDQVYLLKHGAIQIISIRQIKDFNHENLTWSFGTNKTIGLIKIDIMKECKHNVYELAKLYLTTFYPQWNFDQIILDLLSVIVLFNPSRPNLKCTQVVRHQQYVYMYLLQRYLLLKYRSESESKSKFLTLMKCLELVTKIGERSLQNVLERKSSYRQIMGPLVREILDI